MPDDPWDRVASLLSPHPPSRLQYLGRLLADDRAALSGIVCIPLRGVTWADLPIEAIGCSGVTCWRRAQD
ncbi:transposase [Streptomyces albidoflavus]